MIRLCCDGGSCARCDGDRAGLRRRNLPPKTFHLQARIVAVGLPGVAGVRQVGRFHSGGPIPAIPSSC